MSVRECALIQTFPIDFEFVGSLGNMYKQIGNAVLFYWLKKLQKKLKKNYKKKMTNKQIEEAREQVLK